jgi:hypothetical protein
MRADAEMSETTDDNEALQRRNRNSLAAAAAVAVLCVLGIVVLRMVQRLLNKVVRGRTDEQ